MRHSAKCRRIVPWHRNGGRVKLEEFSEMLEDLGSFSELHEFHTHFGDIGHPAKESGVMLPQFNNAGSFTFELNRKT